MLTRRSFTFTAAAAGIAAPAILRIRPAFAAEPRVRRNASKMAADDPFFADYAAAVEAMHKLPPGDRRQWRNLALIHLQHCPHGANDFLHWHRWYIYYFEQICGALIGKPGFALAYWDWEGPLSKIPAPFFDRPELNVTHWKDKSDAQSSHWGPRRITTAGVRGIAKGQTMLSIKKYARAYRPSTLLGIRRQNNFSIFETMLERTPHNSGHLAVGAARPKNGHMSEAMSPLDPVFWLHHANCDRFWAEWDAAGNRSTDPQNSYANHFTASDGNPAPDVDSTAALSIENLGYTYDTLEPVAVASNARQLQLEASDGMAASIANMKLTEPVAVGAGFRTQSTRAGGALEIAVSVPDLGRILGDSRIFRATAFTGAPRNALEPRRVIAKIDGLMPPAESSGFAVGVFINSPNLSAETSTDDKNCAGVFSFFGAGGSHEAEHGEHGGGVPPVYVDVSETLRTLSAEGALKNDAFTLQLMPFSAADGAPAGPALAFGGVSILSA